MLMRLFIPLFASLLAMAHVYMFLSLRRAFRPGVWQYFAAAFLIAAFGSFFLRRFFAPRTFDTVLTTVAYFWIGFLFILCIFLAARDLAWVATWLVDRLAGTSIHPFVTGMRSMRAAFAVGLLAFGWALYEANDIGIKAITVKTDRLPPGVERLRIVAVTDLHINPGTPIATIDRVVRLANRQNPDIAVALGDFIDGRFAPDSPQAKALGKFHGRAGKFAVLGNHELYSGVTEAIPFIQGSGFTLLRGESVDAGGIAIAGVDDPQVVGRKEIADTLRSLSPDQFVLLLSHRPEAPAEALGLFDLELSGHTHGGQIWPAGLLVRFLHGFTQGLTGLAAPEGRPRARSLVYVSNGTRHWGPPVRFLTPPEITVVDLVRDDAKEEKETIR